MPCDYRLLPHSGIQTLAPYIPGKSTEELAKESGLVDIIKLASNENPLGCSPHVMAAIANIPSKQIATYPSPVTHPLRSKLADKLGLDASMITLGNGTDALFPVIMNSFALHNHKHILLHDYAFIIYSIQAKTLGIPVISVPMQADWQVDIDAMIEACNEKTALIFLANPNNPVGALIKFDDIKRLLSGIPESTLVVLDEAYHEYVDDPYNQKSIDLLAIYPNLIITRTFSKAYGLAGLRVGYSIAHPDITAILWRVMTSFTVNQVALTAACAALDDEHFIKETILTNTVGLKQVRRGFKNLNINCLPSAGNFLTFDFKKDAGPLYQKLQGHGIIVRPLHPYGLANFIRVTIGTEQQNYRFLNELGNVIKELENEK